MSKGNIFKMLAGSFLAVAMLIGGLGEALAAPGEPGPKITIRLSHSYPVTYIRHKSALKWKELLEKESKGQVEVKIFPAGQLQKSSGEMDAVVLGNVDMIAVHGGQNASIVPLWDIFAMPFLWPCDEKNFDPAWKFKTSEIVKRAMVPKLEQKGIKFLGFMTALGCAANFSTTNRAVRKASDFKGLKMNTAAGWIRYEAVKALGASCVTLPVTELSTALSQGTIDGEFSTFTQVLTAGYPVKYLHWWPSWTADTGSAFLMNMKKWNSLPDDIKKIIDSYVTPETQKWTNKEVLVEEAQAVVELKKRGMQFVDPDPGTIAECKKRVSPVYNLYEKKYGKEGQEIMAAAKAGVN